MKYDTIIKLPMYDFEKRDLDKLHANRGILLQALKDIQRPTFGTELIQEIRTAVENLDNAQMKLDTEMRNLIGKIYWRIFEEDNS